MSRLGRLGILLQELGGVILFWIVLREFGLKPAIAATTLFVLLDGARRRLRGLPLTKIWMLSNTLALVCGVIDLRAATPFMIRYEAVLTNLVTGTVFLIGAFGSKPMIQEIAEDWQGSALITDPDLRTFFRAFTLVWTAYFFIKAVAYLRLAQVLPFQQALAVRSVAGTASFVIMLLISMRGRQIHALTRRWNLLSGR